MPTLCLDHCDLFSGGSYNVLSLSFCFLKKHMLDFAQIISVFLWWRFFRDCVGTRLSHVDVRRSVNGGLMLAYFSVTLGVAVSMREN